MSLNLINSINADGQRRRHGAESGQSYLTQLTVVLGRDFSHD